MRSLATRIRPFMIVEGWAEVSVRTFISPKQKIKDPSDFVIYLRISRVKIKCIPSIVIFEVVNRYSLSRPIHTYWCQAILNESNSIPPVHSLLV